MYTRFAAITQTFRSRNSQSVRIPKQFRVDADEVVNKRRGEELVLRKRPANLTGAYELLAGSVEGFPEVRSKAAEAPKTAGALMRYLLDTDICIYIESFD